MRRITLLACSIFMLTATPSFAAITFYSSASSWQAALTAGVTYDFGTGDVPNWTVPYSATLTPGTTIGNQTRDVTLNNGLGNWASSGLLLGGSPWLADLGSGRYLDLGDTYQDLQYGGNILPTGTQVEDLVNGAWIQDASSTLMPHYNQYDTEQDQKLTITPPDNQSGAAFQLAATFGGVDRSVAVTVTTVGGLSQTFYGLAGNQSLTFFGFGVDSGDTISSITVSGLVAPVSDTVGPAWNVNGNVRTRTWDGLTSANSAQYDYRLGLDNLQFGTADQPPPPPPDGGGDPGTVPESSTFLLAGTGLVAAGFLSRKRR